MIVSKRKYEPVLPRVKSSDVKPNIIESERKIGQKSVMSIHEFFIDRYDPAHLIDQEIHDMERIIEAIAEGDNSMGQLFAEALSVDGAAALLVSVYMPFLHG